MRQIEIHEVPGGWAIDGIVHPTAVDALRAVRAESKVASESSPYGMDVVRVVWCPTSELGRLIIKVVLSD